jgi:Dyp-type peroxidase family
VTPAADDPKRILPLSANPFHKADRYRDLGFNGSYVVYRKLEQDVASLWRFLQSESIRVKGRVEAEFMVWLGAKMVGRWPSGAPLVLAPDGDQNDLHTDDFLYAREDPQGLACPFGSHIRRTNPRDQIGATGPVESQHMSARHRIMRRGKPYGAELFDPTLLTRAETLQAIVDLVDDGQQRGVHFLCVNASIKDQFEFVQQTWVNNPSFSGLVKNPDPLVGKADSEADPGVMLVPGQQETLHTETLPRLITVRGGMYGFMPSLTALRYLSELT